MQISNFYHHRRLSNKPGTPFNPDSLLKDLDQPFVYNVKLHGKPYRFEFSDTSSPENYTLLRPDVIVMCYDIGNQRSLDNVKTRVCYPVRQIVVLVFVAPEDVLISFQTVDAGNHAVPVL
jgi:hypothetical protein